MAQQLQDKTIVVTKPANRASALVHALEKLGASVIAFPTIAIKPCVLSATDISTIAQLNQYQLVIFTSPTTIELGLPLIKQHWHPLPAHLHYATIGASSAKLLLQSGINRVLYPQATMTSEGLLALSALKNLSDKKVLIITGQGGRTLLQDSLTERGALVERLEVYQRTQATTDPASLINALGTQAINAIITTSSESLLNLFYMLPKDKHDLLKTIPFLVIDSKMQSLAIRLGCQSDIMLADNATDDAILNCLQRAKK